MLRSKRLLGVLVGLLALSLTVGACGGGTSSADNGSANTAQGPNNLLGSLGGGSSSLSNDSSLRSSVEFGYPAVQYSTDLQFGISVSAQGEVTTVPDLAILDLGVEAKADTVELARSEAAVAMELVLQALKDRSIEDGDIQTRYFNIYPEYVWNDLEREQELSGYRVSNQVTIKIRDVENVGSVIDDSVEAGGDLIRVQSVRFTVDDRADFEAAARQKAVENLLAKANQLAEATGVVLGKPVSLVESGGFVPQFQSVFTDLAVAESAPKVATSINPGELEVTISVQGVFTFE